VAARGSVFMHLAGWFPTTAEASAFLPSFALISIWQSRHDSIHFASINYEEPRSFR